MDFPANGPYPIFVYGTLKPGGFYYPAFCEDKVQASIPAMVRGWIYHLPHEGYPAVVVPESLDAESPWVHGYVHWFAERTDALALDRLEGYTPGTPPERNEYLRISVPAFDPSGTPFATAWTYVMSPERVRALAGQIIPNGNWQPGVLRPPPERPDPNSR